MISGARQVSGRSLDGLTPFTFANRSAMDHIPNGRL